MAFDPVLRDAQERSTAPERLNELSTHRSIDIRIEVAKNHSAPLEVLESMRADRSARIRQAVAENAALSDDLVLALGEDPIAAVRYSAALNARGRQKVALSLTGSPDPRVREIVASLNDSVEQLDRSIQEALAGDDSWEARARIASSTQYRDLFDSLLADSHGRVRGGCGGNPRATLDDLETLLGDRSAVTRRIAVALGVLYPNDDQLVRLARDRSAQVQWAVVMRISTPREAVEIVANEGDEMNRHQAAAVLAGGGNTPSAVASEMRSRDEARLLGPFV